MMHGRRGRHHHVGRAGDIRRLEYFLAAVDSGGFNRTAAL